MLPRVHTLQCDVADFQEVKRELESKGYTVYDPLISGSTACVTYLRSMDVNGVALKIFKPEDISD